MAFEKEIKIKLTGLKEFKELELSVDQSNKSVKELIKEIDRLNKALKGVSKGSAEFKKLNKELLASKNALSNIGKNVDKFENLSSSFDNATKSAQDLNKQLVGVGLSTEEAAEAVEKLEEKLEEAGEEGKKSADKQRKSFEKLRKTIKLVRNAFGIIGKAFEFINKSLTKSQAGVDKLTELSLIFDAVMGALGKTVSSFAVLVVLVAQQIVDKVQIAFLRLSQKFNEITNVIIKGFNVIRDFLGKDLLPLLEDTGDGIDALQKTITNRSEEISKATDTLAISFINIGNVFASATAKAQVYINALKLAELAGIQLISSTNDLQRAQANFGGVVDDANASFKARLEAINGLVEATDKFIAVDNKAAKLAVQATLAEANARNGLNLTLDTGIEKTKQLLLTRGASRKEVAEVVKQLEEYNTKLIENDDRLATLGISQARVSLELQKTSVAIQTAFRDLELNNVNKTIKREVDSINQSVADAFSDAGSIADLEKRKSKLQEIINGVPTLFDNVRTQLDKRKGLGLEGVNQNIQESIDTIISNGRRLGVEYPKEIEKLTDLTGQEILTFLSNQKNLENISKEQADILRDLALQKIKVEEEYNDELQGLKDTEEQIRRNANKEIIKTEQDGADALAKINEDKKKLAEDQKKALSAIEAEIANESLNLASEVTDRLFEEQQQRLQNEIDAKEQQLQVQRELLEESKQNAQTATDEIKNIEAQLADGRNENTEQLLSDLDKQREAQAKAVADAKQAEKEEKKLQKEKEKAEKQALKLQKQNAKAQAVIQLSQATISGALAFNQALAVPPSPNIPLAALTATLTGLQIAIIAAQQFAEGGFVGDSPKKYSEGGYLVGPSHAQGGIPAIVGGQRPVELEGKEYVIKGDAVEYYGRDTFDRLNAMKFEDGGIVSSTTDVINDFDNQDNKLLDAFREFAQRPSLVSVQEIRTVNTNVSVIEEDTSL